MGPTKRKNRSDASAAPALASPSTNSSSAASAAARGRINALSRSSSKRDENVDPKDIMRRKRNAGTAMIKRSAKRTKRCAPCVSCVKCLALTVKRCLYDCPAYACNYCLSIAPSQPSYDFENGSPQHQRMEDRHANPPSGSRKKARTSPPPAASPKTDEASDGGEENGESPGSRASAEDQVGPRPPPGGDGNEGRISETREDTNDADESVEDNVAEAETNPTGTSGDGGGNGYSADPSFTDEHTGIASNFGATSPELLADVEENRRRVGGRSGQDGEATNPNAAGTGGTANAQPQPTIAVPCSESHKEMIDDNWVYFCPKHLYCRGLHNKGSLRIEKTAYDSKTEADTVKMRMLVTSWDFERDKYLTTYRHFTDGYGSDIKWFIGHGRRPMYTRVQWEELKRKWPKGN